jgi:hypothetical protein
MFELKQPATDKVIPFLLVSSTDHINGVTGLTPTVTLSKNGGAFAAPSGAVAEIGNGFYKLTPNAADTGTTGALILHASSAGADPCDVVCRLVTYDPYDAASLGLSNLDAAVTSRVAPGDTMSLDLSQAVPTQQHQPNGGRCAERGPCHGLRHVDAGGDNANALRAGRGDGGEDLYAGQRDGSHAEGLAR